MLNAIKGSYLFGDDPKRIIQDPESLRASSVRQGATWMAWAQLRDSVLFQINSSDHNPAVRTDLSPNDSWELSTPQMLKYYVKAAATVMANTATSYRMRTGILNPLANDIEGFVIALANMDVAVMLRVDRFTNPFFTGIKPFDVLAPAESEPVLRWLRSGRPSAGDPRANKSGCPLRRCDHFHGRGFAGADADQGLPVAPSGFDHVRPARPGRSGRHILAGYPQDAGQFAEFRARADGRLDRSSKSRPSAPTIPRSSRRIPTPR